MAQDGADVRWSGGNLGGWHGSFKQVGNSCAYGSSFITREAITFFLRDLLLLTDFLLRQSMNSAVSEILLPIRTAETPYPDLKPWQFDGLPAGKVRNKFASRPCPRRPGLCGFLHV